MKKYIITYLEKNGEDCCKVWVSARNRKEAESNFKAEYWDWKEIINIREA